MSVYYLDGWPSDRAPAEWHITRSRHDGSYSSHASLWVRTDGGSEDLWTSSLIPMTYRGDLLTAQCEAQRLARELEAERDQMYAERAILDDLYAQVAA